MSKKHAAPPEPEAPAGTSLYGRAIEEWPVTKFIAYEQNPRKHSPERVAQFAMAIKRYGWRYPVLAKSNGQLVDGHFRLKVAEHLGLERIPVVVVDDMTDEQVREFRLSVNRMAELAEWDQDNLLRELESVDLLGGPLGESGPLGFGLEELDTSLETNEWDLSPTKDTFVVTITGSLPLEAEVRARLKGMPGVVTVEASSVQRA